MGGSFYQNVANTVANNRAQQQYAGMFHDVAMTALEMFQKHIADKQADEYQAALDAPKAQAVTADGSPYTGSNGIIAPDPLPRDQQEGYNAGLGFTDYDTTPNVPNAGGVQGLKLRRALSEDQLKRSILQRRLAGPVARTVDPLDTAYKQDRNALLSKKLAAFGVPARGAAGARPMTEGQSATDARVRARDAFRQRLQDSKAQDDQFQAATGLHPSQWGVWSNPHLSKGGVPDASGDTFEADVADPKTGSRHITMPVDQFRRGQKLLAERGTTQATAPAAAAPSGGGTVRVQHPDGTTGTIPASQLDEALANGYTQL